MARPNHKLMHAAQLLLEYSGGSMQRTNLNKALFYLDVLWFRDHGETLTGASYVAIDHGPVVDNYRTELIGPLLESGTVAENRVEYGPGMTAMPLALCTVPAPPEDEHLELLARRVADFASGRTAVDLSAVSHENPGWRAAIARGKGTTINMMLAIQQMEPEDPWLTEPLTEADTERLARLLQAEPVPFE